MDGWMSRLIDGLYYLISNFKTVSGRGCVVDGLYT